MMSVQAFVMQHSASSVPVPADCTAALIESALRQNPQLRARTIEWLVQDGTLVLRGTVASFYQKQLAQTAARRLPGVERIVNELEVEEGEP